MSRGLEASHRPQRPTITRHVARFAALLLFAASVQASPPSEAQLCTNAPRSEWLSEQQVRQIFDESQYALVKFKVSKTNCYEFYAIAKDNTVVEAYYNPLSGQRVRHTTISPPSSASK